MYNIRNGTIVLPVYEITRASDRCLFISNESQFFKYCQHFRDYLDFLKLIDEKKKNYAIDKYYNMLNQFLSKFYNSTDMNCLSNLLLLNVEKNIILNFKITLSYERILIKMASAMIEILDSEQHLDKSIILTCRLLLQCKYNKRKRGYWWNRLALNVEKRKKDLVLVIYILYF